MAEPTIITDADGRKLELREMTLADQLDLLDAAGDSSGNSGYVRMVTLLFMVAKIDGAPVPPPANKKQIRLHATRLGNAGLVALYAHLFPVATEDAPDTARAQTLAAAKN